MNRVHVVASEPHFLSHVLPVWLALPDECRGGLWTGTTARSAGTTKALASSMGITMERSPLPRSIGTAYVASVGDLMRVMRTDPSTHVAYAEHGCGISYNVAQSSFIGSSNRPGCAVILTPNEETATKQWQATPDIPVVALGDEPRMDRRRLGPAKVRDERPTIALSFHWDSEVVPETRSTLYWYREHLGDLVVSNPQWRFIGHAHPRMLRHAQIVYAHAGIEFVANFERVMNEADVYVVDNSSTLYEFASLNRPVVVLNCPRYRRWIHHGLRFWESIPGPQVDDYRQLAPTIATALEDPPEWSEIRHAAVERVFPQRDGGATARAVDAVLAHIEGRPAARRRLLYYVGGVEFINVTEADRYAARIGVPVRAVVTDVPSGRGAHPTRVPARR